MALYEYLKNRLMSVLFEHERTMGILQRLASERAKQMLVNTAAESYVTDIHDYIGQGRAFRPRTGLLQQSINWRPLDSGRAEVYANASYARLVEQGTRPKGIIQARYRKALKIPIGGGFIFRRSYKHKGSRPYPYFFADMPARQQRIRQRGILALARLIDE